MSKILYNKYRPTKIADLVGQDEIKEFLVNLDMNNYPKAVIFHGPSGAGKTTSVRLFTNKLWHPNESGEDIADDAPDISRSFDYEELSGVENSGVGDMRELKDRARLASMGGKPRIFVIDEAHGLSAKAFDALLKVTEDSTYNVFIFVTTEFDKIPKTIKTRTIDFQFREPDVHELKEYVSRIAGHEGYQLDDELAGVIAFKSDASYRSACTVLEKVINKLDKGVVNTIETVGENSSLLSKDEINSMKVFPSLLRSRKFYGIVELLTSFKNDERELKNFCFYMYNYSRKVLSSRPNDKELLAFLIELGDILKDQRLPINRTTVEVAIFKTLERLSK